MGKMRLKSATIRLAIVAAAICPVPALALCVTNGTDQVLFFIVEADETGGWISRPLGPEESLCVAGSRSGVVTAFASAESFEGCTRPAVTGDRLLDFVPFDSCTWASHLTPVKAPADE